MGEEGGEQGTSLVDGGVTHEGSGEGYNVGRVTADNLLETPVVSIVDKLETLTGIKLPKSNEQWKSANLYFHSQLVSLPSVQHISEHAAALQSMIYNYFAENIGTVASRAESHDLEIKYRDWPVCKLRSALNKLKHNSSARLDENKYVSHALRKSSGKHARIFSTQ